MMSATPVAEIIIGKQRNRATGAVDLRVENQSPRFENMSEKFSYGRSDRTVL